MNIELLDKAVALQQKIQQSEKTLEMLADLETAGIHKSRVVFDKYVTSGCDYTSIELTPLLVPAVIDLVRKSVQGVLATDREEFAKL